MSRQVRGGILPGRGNSVSKSPAMGGGVAGIKDGLGGFKFVFKREA